ncbi:ESPR-type extended signal peptide-containing protein, partial [uncultured Psychrobacter sp.]|uniref:ESPR-type extended signal peptide-containing protein n=1 Tax=uncultured Psychrobacter sp. TaxID=259303 RepID=UPI0030D88426
MNHIYKVVRCNATGVFKAVPEHAKSGKKSKSVSLASAVMTTVSTPLSFYKKPLTMALAVLGFSALSVIPAQADYGSDSRQMIYDLQDRVEDINVTVGSGAQTIASRVYPAPAQTQIGSIAIGHDSQAFEYKRHALDADFDERYEAAIAKQAAAQNVSVSNFKAMYMSDTIAVPGLAETFERNVAQEYYKNNVKMNTAIGGQSTALNGGTAIGSGSYSDDAGTVSFGTKRRVDSATNAVIAQETRRLVNVSDGIDATDAATIGQLQTAVRDLGSSEVFAETIADKADKTYVDSENAKQDTAINTATTTNNTQNTAIQTNKNNIAT